MIRRISSDHPGWGEDRIADELAIKLGIRHSTSTIRRYMVRRRKPRGGQTWRTFIKNHASQIFAADFLTQCTAFFTVVYIFVVMEIATRRIVLINATTSPGLAWVKQQIRQATDWAKAPRFLLHDNDGVFGQFRDPKPRGKNGRRYRCHLDLWRADVMGIEGIPIPYGAPNASPHIERFNRSLREEALNHFIFPNVKHIRRACAAYRDFYNGARPSQALHAIPEPYPESSSPPPKSGKLIALPVLGGVQHDYRLAAQPSPPGSVLSPTRRRRPPVKRSAGRAKEHRLTVLPTWRRGVLDVRRGAGCRRARVGWRLQCAGLDSRGSRPATGALSSAFSPVLTSPVAPDAARAR
jgi:hypothetical protein